MAGLALIGAAAIPSVAASAFLIGRYMAKRITYSLFKDPHRCSVVRLKHF